MTDENSTNNQSAQPMASAPQPVNRPSAWRMRTIALVGGVLLLGVGVAAGAGATRMMVRHEPQPLMPPIAISAMTDGSVVAVKGKVTDVYGNKFVVEDPTGRTLVDTGRAGRRGKLVARDEAVTVQGRFDDGVLRGSMIVRADGRTDIIRGPDGPGRHGKKGMHDRP